MTALAQTTCQAFNELSQTTVHLLVKVSQPKDEERKEGSTDLRKKTCVDFSGFDS